MLGYYGDAVRAQPQGSALRVEAIVVVLHCAASHRRAGVTWSHISQAAGFGEATLRSWQRRYGPAAKSTITANPNLLPWSVAAPASVHHHRAPRPVVLLGIGHPEPGGNDFHTEAAQIRALLGIAGLETVALPCVEIAELRDYLDTQRPAVLHLAAHGNTTGVALSTAGQPLWVAPTDLVAAIRASRHRLQLVLLNVCYSGWAARALTTAADSVIAWNGPLDDEQACVFAIQLYRRLGTGMTVGNSYQSALIEILARWPELAPTRYGSSTVTLAAPPRCEDLPRL